MRTVGHTHRRACVERPPLLRQPEARSVPLVVESCFAPRQHRRAAHDRVEIPARAVGVHERVGPREVADVPRHARFAAVECEAHRRARGRPRATRRGGRRPHVLERDRPVILTVGDRTHDECVADVPGACGDATHTVHGDQAPATGGTERPQVHRITQCVDGPELGRTPIERSPFVDDDRRAFAARPRCRRDRTRAAGEVAADLLGDPVMLGRRHRARSAAIVRGRRAARGDRVLRRIERRRLAHAPSRMVIAKGVAGDAIVAAARVALLGIHPVRRLDRVRPEIDRGRVAAKGVARDRVVLPMLDGDRHTVAGEAVAGDLALVAVAAPDAMIVPLDDVGHEPIATECRLDPVGRREREVIGEEEVVVRTARTGVHGALPCPEEEPVAAVRDRVPSDHVVAALLVHEESRRVLAATVPTMRIAAHVVVHAIANHDVPARAVHPDAESGVEREDVVAHRHALGPRHQQRVHALFGAIAPDLAAGHALEVDRRAEPHPLALLVLVVREPVDETLVPHEREEPRLPVVREVVLREHEMPRATREYRDMIPADRRTPDRDVTPAVDTHRDALPLVGRSIDCRALEPHATHVDGDPCTAHGHQRRVERSVGRQPVRPRRDPHRRGDRHPGLERHRARRRLGESSGRERQHKKQASPCVPCAPVVKSCCRGSSDHRCLLGGTNSAPNSNPAVNASNALITATNVSNPTA